MRVDCFDGVVFAEVMVDDAAVTAAETAAETAAARSDSGVDVGWDCDVVVTARTCEADCVGGDDE